MSTSPPAPVRGYTPPGSPGDADFDRIRAMLENHVVADAPESTPPGFMRIERHEAILGAMVSRFLIELDTMKARLAELEAQDRRDRANFFRKQVQNLLTAFKDTGVASAKCVHEVSLVVVKDPWVLKGFAFSIASSGLIIGLIIGISSVATRVQFGDMVVEFEGAGRSADAQNESRIPVPTGSSTGPGVSP